MAAPTVSDYQQSSFADITAGDEVTPALTWNAGDYILAIGITEDNATATMNVPTATGLTFTQWLATNTALNCKVYIWDATAAAGGSQAVTATRSDANTKARGLAVFAFSTCAGRGNSGALTPSGSATTQSLVRGGNNSAVVFVLGDFAADPDVTVTSSPAAGATQRVATTSGNDTNFILSWTDQGAAGTTSYGFSAGGAVKSIGYALELLASAAAGRVPYQPQYQAAPVLAQ